MAVFAFIVCSLFVIGAFGVLGGGMMKSVSSGVPVAGILGVAGFIFILFFIVPATWSHFVPASPTHVTHGNPINISSPFVSTPSVQEISADEGIGDWGRNILFLIAAAALIALVVSMFVKPELAEGSSIAFVLIATFVNGYLL